LVVSVFSVSMNYPLFVKVCDGTVNGDLHGLTILWTPIHKNLIYLPFIPFNASSPQGDSYLPVINSVKGFYKHARMDSNPRLSDSKCVIGLN